jgi:hypothetical protein
MRVMITEQMRVELGIPYGCTKDFSYINWHVYVDSRCLRRYKRKWLKGLGLKYHKRCELTS